MEIELVALLKIVLAPTAITVISKRCRKSCFGRFISADKEMEDNSSGLDNPDNFEDFEDAWEEPKLQGPSTSRKRRIQKENWKKNKKKNIQVNNIQPCKHVNHERSGFCQIKMATNETLFGFRDKFNKIESAIDQRKFIQRFITVQLPVRSRVSDLSRKRSRNLSTSFFIPTPNKRIQVCKDAFEKVLGVGRRKLENAAKSMFEPDEVMIEKRGGARFSEEKLARQNKIIAHIKTFRCRERHYGRNKTPLRAYLPSDLSIKKMWAMFQIEDPSCKYSTYYSTFVRKFNLGFGSPKSDVCSCCVRLKTARSAEKDNEKKKTLILEYAVHIRRAKTFFKELNTHHENTIEINFDLMQNQPLPKTPVGESFYSRQMWFYIFGVVIHDQNSSLTKENVHFYRWLESEYGRGANVIISCLSHFLNNVLPSHLKNRPTVTTLRLFCDSCASQNKNYAMVLMLMKFCALKKLNFEWYFPVRGHSYMPADRAFGIVEKKLRKIDTVVMPQKYDDILKEVGTLKTSRQFMVHSWTETAKYALKAGEKGFKISTCKKISFDCENYNYVRVQPSYHGASTTHKITKKKFKDLRNIPLNLKLIKKQNQMSMEKIKDVQSLLVTIGIDWISDAFYSEILKTTPNVVIPKLEDDTENNIAFYSEDEDSDSID